MATTLGVILFLSFLVISSCCAGLLCVVPTVPVVVEVCRKVQVGLLPAPQ